MIRNRTKTALSIAVVAVVSAVLTTSAFADYTIYSDDFSGGGGDLHGTTPDIAHNIDPFVSPTWHAAVDTFYDDGTIDATPTGNPDARGGGGAYLPFIPEAGHLYTLSADINNLTEQWVGVGFVEEPYNPWINDDSGRHEQGANGTSWVQFYPGSAIFKSEKTTTVHTEPVGGTNSIEILLDSYNPNAVQVSFNLNGGAAEFSYDAGSLATMGVSNQGIHGVGFSVRGMDVNGTVVDSIDNLLLISDGDLPPTLSLEVNTSTGEAMIQGHASADIDINYYQILSDDANSIDPNAWSSLDDQNLATFEGIAGDFTKDDLVDSVDLTDPTDGWETRFGADLAGSDFLDWQGNFGSSGTPMDWEEGGGVGTHVLAEGVLVGSSTIAAASSTSLGLIYDEQPGSPGSSEDWKFYYRTADGRLNLGEVTFVGAAVAAGTVPEPSSLALVAVGLLGMSYRRRKLA